MRPERTVLAALPRALLESVAELGHDAERLREEAGLPAACDLDPDARVPLRAHLALWEAIAGLGGDVGLELGQRLGLRALGVVGFVIAHRASVRDALQDLERFRRVVLEDAVPRWVVQEGAGGTFEAALVQALPARVARLRHPAEAQASASLAALRALAGEVRVHRAAFPHPAPPDLSPHRRLFGPRLEFGAARLELVLDAAVLERPNRRADPSLAAYLARRAEALLAELSEARWSDRARAVVLDRMVEGEPSAGAVAGVLGTSSRTLQRRLREEGTSFAALLDDARHTRALALLSDPTRTAAEIAFALGFRDPPAFFRAFRRWTGQTPRAWRSRTLSGA